ncbi:MAG: DUF3971 domain-containing protein [Defluviicoccus sp.]|nr:DUF3971 domain-containing protein [Defluviicoccus sp.]MDE0385307.1 DUF3971 domain-containing protein [Defluviicoccus sp.]
MRRLLRIGVDVALLSALTLVGVALLGAWRLSEGPVSLGFLKPDVEQRLAALDLPNRIAFSDVVLTWGGTRRPLDLVMSNAELRGKDDVVVARVPELSIGLSPAALLDGRLVLKTIRLSDAGVSVVRRKDGTLSIGLAGEGGRSLTLFESGGEGGSGESLLGKLERVAIHRASVSLEDRLLGLRMSPDRVSVDFERRDRAIVCVFDLDGWSGDERLSMGGIAEYRLRDRTTQVSLDFRGLVPDRLAPILARWFPRLPDLRGVSVPLEGHLAASSGADGSIQDARFTIGGGTGTLRLAELGDHRYDIRSLAFDGRYGAADGAVEIDRLDIDFGKPRLTLTGRLAGVDRRPRLNARAKLAGMTMSALPRYWPEGVAEGARRWLAANLNRGEVRDLAADLALSFADGGVQIEGVKVTLRLARATLHYLKPLPPITEARGSVTIGRDRIRIVVDGGGVSDLVLAGGLIDITGLSADTAHMALRGRVTGPLATALSVLDHPRLGYASKVGLRPGGVGGRLEMRIEASLPLIDALALDDAKLGAAGTLTGAVADGAFLGEDLAEGALRFTLNNRGMKIDGDARISGVAAAVGWREDFTGTEEPRRRYGVRARLTEADRRRLGVTLAPLVRGPVSVAADYAVFSGGAARATGTLDAAEAEVALPPLEWWKPPGVKGRASFEIAFDGGRARAIRIKDLVAGDLRAAGQVRLDRGSIHRVEIGRLAVPDRFDLAGALSIDEAEGWTIDASGRLFDAAPIQRLTGGEGDSTLPPLRIAARLDRVLLTAGRSVEKASLGASYRDGSWQAIDLSGQFPNGKRFDLSYRPRDGAGRLQATSMDAGEMFGLVGETKWVRGGRLTVSAEGQTGAETRQWKGKIAIRDFVLTGAPRLVQALRLASLGALSEELGGRGVRVTALDIPFTHGGSKLRLSEARAFGPGIGVTGSGTIDVDEETVEIDGTLVPAYPLNAALGEVPGIGFIFSGEKGGGLFAAPFAIRGKVEQPSFTVNPLGVLTPGVFRNIFRLFDARREDAPPETQPKR